MFQKRLCLYVKPTEITGDQNVVGAYPRVVRIDGWIGLLEICQQLR